MTTAETIDRVNALISGEPFALSYEAKRKALLPILAAQIRQQREAIAQYDRYCRRMRFDDGPAEDYAELPYLPVSVFKWHDLCAVPPEAVVRVLTSSATTSGTASRIFLDKSTSFRQSKALSRILMHFLGKHKRPLLVLDAESSNAAGDSLSARGAAIRGLAAFASEVVYALRDVGGELVPDVDVLNDFAARHGERDVLIFGFTYMVWINTIARLRERGIELSLPRGVLLHSGGWKRLTELAVDKATFNRGVATTLGVPEKSVLDFYGMVEQVGVIFVDCEAGAKHTPAFAEATLRDVLTLAPVEVGQSGLIEVFSVLPTSYPGQALLTEDVGVLLGFDDCPCGRPGVYFRFRSRVEQAELRGCGDTFAAGRVVR
jgi:hypothetical protein